MYGDNYIDRVVFLRHSVRVSLFYTWKTFGATLHHKFTHSTAPQIHLGDKGVYILARNNRGGYKAITADPYHGYIQNLRETDIYRQIDWEVATPYQTARDCYLQGDFNRVLANEVAKTLFDRSKQTTEFSHTSAFAYYFNDLLNYHKVLCEISELEAKVLCIAAGEVYNKLYRLESLEFDD